MAKSTEIKMPTNELTHAQRTGMRSKWTGKKKQDRQRIAMWGSNNYDSGSFRTLKGGAFFVRFFFFFIVSNTFCSHVDADAAEVNNKIGLFNKTHWVGDVVVVVVFVLGWFFLGNLKSGFYSVWKFVQCDVIVILEWSFRFGIFSVYFLFIM